MCEVNATRALEAIMEGFQVLPMAQAACLGDIFVTATGMMGVNRAEHFDVMKDGAILANSGHFDVEVEVAALNRLAVQQRLIRDHLVEYRLSGGKVLYLLAQGRLVGQVAAEASPATVMDLSFANQALCTRYLLQAYLQLAPAVYDVPSEIDERVARMKVQACGVQLDTLTDEQIAYQHTWSYGTV